MLHLKNKLLLIFTVLSLVPILVIGFFSYKISTDSLLKKINAASLSTLIQINRNADTKAEKIMKYMDILFTNSNIQKIMTEVDFSRQTGDVYIAYTELDPMIGSLFYRDSDVIYAGIIPYSGGNYNYKGYVSDIDKLKNSEWYSKIVQGQGSIYWDGLMPNPELLSNEKNVFIVGRVVRDTLFRKSIDPLGVVVLFLSEGFFTDIYKDVEIGDHGTIMFSDGDGKLLAPDSQEKHLNLREYPFGEKVLKEKEGYFKQSVNGRELMVSFHTSEITGWKVISTVPYSYYVREVSWIGWMTSILAIVCFVLVWVISLILSEKISKPIKRLVLAMKQVGDKNFEVSVPVSTRDEVGLICSGFNVMVSDIKQLFNTVVEEEKEKRRIYLRSLQYQINPHFLYNTLSSIRFYANAEHAGRVADMILVLSRLLRNTINKVGKNITLSEEIANLKDYIFIQQMRYKNRITLSFHISEKVLGYKIPGMLLQPLVENSIARGLGNALAQNSQECLIKISAEEAEGELLLEIWDNGIGMTEKQIIDVYNSSEEQLHGTAHIGIKNIHERIQFQFGQQFGIKIESIPEQYTLVKINLPVLSEKEGEKLVKSNTGG